MRRIIIYVFIALLYLLTPICIMAILGTEVSKKYEVDEGYWHIDVDKTITEEQKRQKIEQLDREGNRLSNRISSFTIAALACPTIATVLLVKRKSLIDGKNRS